MLLHMSKVCRVSSRVKLFQLQIKGQKTAHWNWQTEALLTIHKGDKDECLNFAYAKILGLGLSKPIFLLMNCSMAEIKAVR